MLLNIQKLKLIIIALEIYKGQDIARESEIPLLCEIIEELKAAVNSWTLDDGHPDADPDTTGYRLPKEN